MQSKRLQRASILAIIAILVIGTGSIQAQTLAFDFETASVPVEIQPAIIEAVSCRQSDTLVGATFFVIGAFRQSQDLGYGTIGAAIENQPPDWNTSIQFVVYQEQGAWRAALEGTLEYETVAERIPELDRPSNPIQAQATDFKFPWHASQVWCYTSSWHNGEWSVDFAPSASVPADERWFRSSSDGYLTLTCNDGYQAFARVQNGTLGNMGYGHMASATIPGGIVNTDILQGQQLGRAYNGTQGAGWYNIGQPWPWPSCTPDGSCNWNTRTGCCYLQYMTACGAGTGAHSHWTLPGSNTTVDGWTIGADGIWRKSGEPNRGVGSCFASSNTGDTTPPTISFAAPAAGQWYNTDQTISWSITDDNSGVRGYKAAWDQNPPGGGEIPGSNGSTTLGSIGQGQHTLYVQAWDHAGNPSGVAVAGWFGYDVTAPSNPTSVSPGCSAAHDVWQNVCADPAFTWSGAADALSGVAGYQLYWGGDPNGASEYWTSAAAFDPGPVSAGTTYLRARTRDIAGNWSGWTTLFILRYDAAAPTGSVALNNNASTSHTALVYVNTTATDAHSGIYQMRLRDAGGTWTDWMPFSARTLWQLPGVSGQTHTVQVQFKDRAGNISATYQDAIALNIYPARPASTGYRLARSTWGAVGTNGQSASYRLLGTLSQSSMIGQASSSGYRLWSGYWLAVDESYLIYLPIVLRNRP